MVSKKNKKTKGSVKLGRMVRFITRFRKWIVARRLAARSFMNRRPHRSFKRTRRRDYVRSLEMPGYFAFTKEAVRAIRVNMKTYSLLVLTFSLITIVLVGISSQDIFLQLSQTLRDTSGDVFSGSWGEVGKAALLFVSIAGGNVSGAQSETQQIYGALLIIFTWLCTVWLLRAQMAGKRPKLRDGLYTSGAPFVATLLLFLLLIVQLIPAAIAAIGVGSAISSDILGSGFLPFLVAIIAALMSVLSLYFLSSTFFALIIVTLPGMYPWQALRTAGDLVIGRRLRILYRLLWVFLITGLTWLIIMVPLIALTSWLQSSLQQIAFLPVVPVALVFMTTSSIVFIGCYVYLMYRKVVDDDAAPA